MRSFYQTEWQNIPFSSFSEISSKILADSAFYDAFYCALFQKYTDYESLDHDWRRNKDEITSWMMAFLPEGARVLSVGCGLGYMEQRLWRECSHRIDLHVQDYSSQSLRWLRHVMPADRVHDDPDWGQECLTQKTQFNLIYLSAVDYALTDEALVGMLSKLKGCLRGGGEILIISASYLDEESLWQKLVRLGKDIVKWILAKFGFYNKGQFWGWMRSRSDYREVMHLAGLDSLMDGFIQTPNQRTYWIKGSVSN